MIRNTTRLLAATVLLVASTSPIRAAEHTILAKPNNRFEPSTIQIAVGDTVTWSNDGGFHNVNAPGFFRCSNGCDGEGGNGNPDSNAWSFSKTFDDEATIDFFCDPHVGIGMVGTVTVGEGGNEADLSIAGECPGAIDITVAGARPNTPVVLLGGTGEGVGTIPGGPCAGTALAIENPNLLTLAVADSNGEASVTRTVPEAACGLPLQAIDFACTVSNAKEIPSTAEGLIELEEIASGIRQPNTIVHAGDGSGRLFIVSQPGQILIYENGAILPTPFLDVRQRVNSGEELEQGMIGLAFHPDYSQNGSFFVVYSNLDTNSTLSRFQVTGNPNIANPNSEEILLVQPQPEVSHNFGQVVFGPDGYLYIGAGDGGCCNDPNETGQNLGTLLGKILRIDIDGGTPYAIPPSNPFVGQPGARPEIWAYGLRNPWRLSFDRLTGDLFIGDVGQDRLEEIDFQPFASSGGENYGWSRMEGSECFDPPTDCNDGSLTLPILEYPHFDGELFGCAVIGGPRYRGAEEPELDGVYLFADFCSGTIWGGTESGGSWTPTELLQSGLFVSSFGEDEAGELYVADWLGKVFRIRSVSEKPDS